ncbi:amino acid adenylation domain-containing protein [Streptomyces sp. NPDC091292]|uniref:amino acid adenylation domain-containing protein n=1 Tax=Streptomyces sp. NPDC091292 TaxID=3365991 RepID=UPI003827FDB4
MTAEPALAPTHPTTGPDGGLPPVLVRVAHHVRTTPDAPAVTSAEAALTYRQLWSRSEGIARQLLRLGARPGEAVGLHLERSADLIAAIIGTLRAGCVVVPLDVSYPPDRLRYMCDHAGAGLVIGHAEPLARLGRPHPPATDGRLVFTADPDRRPASEPDRPLPAVSGEDLAYIVYTSGSTGRPKGVLYEHRNLANLVAWQISASRCGAGDRTLQFSPASFDVIFQEVFTALGEGGTVVCCTEDERIDPSLLWELIARERVNRLFLPFVMLQSLALFADEATPALHPLREILSTGEQMQCGHHLRTLFERLPDCRLVNQWGTTETHVATWYALPAEVATWPRLPPIGAPIDGSRVIVRAEDGTTLPDGEVGELWISGDCVGPGYLRLPERTAQSYRPDPDDAAVRAYRTGDLGRVGADGNLQCLGRRDTQVKIRGFRIELGEIESLVKEWPGVAEAVVVVADGPGDDRHLLALAVAESGELDTAEMLAALRGKLPAYMVPARVELVPSLPRTPSGKLDRRAAASGQGNADPSAN